MKILFLLNDAHHYTIAKTGSGYPNLDTLYDLTNWIVESDTLTSKK
ncbi:MAG: hypothetical protein JNM78_11110 [Cyclobacteriaceae bacterium]|nr:hypothetical protein [Cyclobacteriaceae bacterium]